MRIQRTPWPAIAAVRVHDVSNESDADPAVATSYELEMSSWPVRGTLSPPTVRFHAVVRRLGDSERADPEVALEREHPALIEQGRLRGAVTREARANRRPQRVLVHVECVVDVELAEVEL